MKFTIDTEVDSYEDALRTVQAAYARPALSVRAQMNLQEAPAPLPPDAVWRRPGRYSDDAWTEQLLRAWVRALGDAESLNLVWKMCSHPGPPGVRGQELGEYISGLTGKPALTVLSVVSRRMNYAARQMYAGVSYMPFATDERTRTRTVDPAVAAILKDELPHHPLWPQLRHHNDPPAPAQTPATDTTQA